MSPPRTSGRATWEETSATYYPHAAANFRLRPLSSVAACQPAEQRKQNAIPKSHGIPVDFRNQRSANALVRLEIGVKAARPTARHVVSGWVSLTLELVRA